MPAVWQSDFFGNFYAGGLAIRFALLPPTSSLPLLPLLRASLTFPPTRPQWRCWCWQDIRVNNASHCRDATGCQEPKWLNNTFPSPTAGLEEVIAAVSVSISRHLPPPRLLLRRCLVWQLLFAERRRPPVDQLYTLFLDKFLTDDRLCIRGSSQEAGGCDS